MEKTNIVAQICIFCNDPIIKMNGSSSTSFCNHHVSYDPDVVVPAHRGCHNRYHRTHPTHPINPEIKHREEFIESLDKSIICHFCGDLIIGSTGKGAKSLAIHSLDGNHKNWGPLNKVPAHNSCHSAFHQSGRTLSEETRRKISEIKKGHGYRVTKSWETRRERYGPSGLKDPEAVYKDRSERMKNRDSNKIWEIRRQRYGPSGFKDLNRWKEAMVEGRKDGAYAKGWKTRRARYGPSGSR